MSTNKTNGEVTPQDNEAPSLLQFIERERLSEFSISLLPLELKSELYGMPLAGLKKST
jgi:hypothetical protein